VLSSFRERVHFKAIMFYEKAAIQSYGPAIARLERLRHKILLSVVKEKDRYTYLFDPCVACYD